MAGRGEGGPRGGRHGYAGPGWGGFGGFPFEPFPGGGRWRGRKARRGDIRMAALLLIGEEPRNGYQIMQELQQRTEGRWRPSPGSVYPALSQLEDEGLIRSQTPEERAGAGQRFAITDAGRQEIDSRPADAAAPWEAFTSESGPDGHELGGLMRSVAIAFAQVIRTGTPEQLEQGRKLLVRLRRDLYRILAEDGPSGEPDGEEDDS